MPALANAKHERFAHEMAKGSTADEAYVSAGYAENRSNAIRLKQNEAVAARVAELLEAAAARAEMTVATVTARLVRIADVAEKTGIKVDDQGEAIEASSKLLGVARQALMDAAKLNGWVVDKVKSESTVNLTVAPDDANL